MKMQKMIPETTYRIARNLWWALQTRNIPFDRILCGGEHGMNGIQFAFHSGDMTRTSTPFDSSPHVEFLRDYLRLGETIFITENLESTAYYRNAARCLQLFGRYFSATREEHIVVLARNFVSNFNQNPISEKLSSSTTYSKYNSTPEVFPIKFSDSFQVKDGNHRLAIARVKGADSHLVRVNNSPQLTSLQQLLLNVSWNVNQRDLYQPISSPELGREWKLVRRCTDRLNLMVKFLNDHRLDKKQQKSYLDVACNYGWFVKSMKEHGYDAYGLEVDKACRMIGKVFYNLDEAQLHASEAMNFFADNARTYDVVSCFSLAHHFALRDNESGLLSLITALDRATDKILFFEMGDEGEEWFTEKLKGWNPLSIEKWLRENTSFSQIFSLGTDQDRIKPFEKNYRRTLFACIK